MTDDMSQSQILMGPSDVCKLLDIKESTLRKYALLLKEAGYHFDTNDKGQRAYYDKDVVVLKRFLEVKESRDMTLEQAANAVMIWVKASDMSLSVTTENKDKERYDAEVKELKETVQQQNELLKELMKKMDEQQRYVVQQQQYIDKRLEDRDAKLMESLRVSQEAKEGMLQLAAAKEEEEKKGFFGRLFGKI